jgi:pectate lyase
MSLAPRVSFVALLALPICTGGCSRLSELTSAGSGDPTPPPMPVPVAARGTPGTSSDTTGATGASGTLTSFPGAEGFGAQTQGGRGGPTCRVTTLAHEGAGSLQSCLDQNGPRIIVFDVSGVIQGPLEIKHGRLTIAGQTSPGGITIQGGMVCDNVYDPNDCNELIVRHVRFRGGAPDSLRLGGTHDVIVDHCSLAAAEDENLELTRSQNITVQNSIVAEPKGDHYQWGGVLINYSKDVMPLDRITIHHTVWNGVAGRLPEISCEENGDGPGKSNCAGHTLAIELVNNVLWDASDPIWFNHCTGNNAGNDCPASPSTFSLALNLVGNVLVRRSSADPDAPLVEPSVYSHPRGAVYSADNLLLRGAGAAIAANGPSKTKARHAFPAVSVTPATSLVAALAKSAGAWPRDPMDQRLSSYLTRPIDARPASWRDGNGVDVGDALQVNRAPAGARPDADGDGMPDAWETQHGLDPRVADGSALGRVPGCANGYAALECYVNELADSLVPR